MTENRADSPEPARFYRPHNPLDQLEYYQGTGRASTPERRTKYSGPSGLGGVCGFEPKRLTPLAVRVQGVALVALCLLSVDQAPRPPDPPGRSAPQRGHLPSGGGAYRRKIYTLCISYALSYKWYFFFPIISVVPLGDVVTFGLVPFHTFFCYFMRHLFERLAGGALLSVSTPEGKCPLWGADRPGGSGGRGAWALPGGGTGWLFCPPLRGGGISSSASPAGPFFLCRQKEGKERPGLRPGPGRPKASVA